MSGGAVRPDVVIIMTDEERATPSYESDAVRAWRRDTLTGRRWFDEHGVSFERHYTGSLACVPSRPTMFTGQYPDLHGVTQTDGLGKLYDDTRLRWLRQGEVPTLGHWFRAGGYDTHYDGKWHISHADLMDPATGQALATCTDDGEIIPDAVQAYLDADPLDAYGFSGWVGPEPHGAPLANSGLRRDPLIADRVVAWLEDRYARRRAGDEAALKPFLLVASFVNPHDIVLFPGWRRNNPMEPSSNPPPHVPEAPTQHEDLSEKPAAQAAYRASYPSGYGPPEIISAAYEDGAQEYRDLYQQLQAEVDGPLDRVRQAVTGPGGSAEAVLVRTTDHGELLGAHGGLHQKWFNLYDECTRIPFVIARTGSEPTAATVFGEMPTSHVDLVPTLLSAAGIDQDSVAEVLRRDFTEVHPLPGCDLMPIVDGDEEPDPYRPVYVMTRDNMLAGDTGASAAARVMGVADDPPPGFRIEVPEGVGTNFEAVVARAAGHLWKLVRTFDDPDLWDEPGVRQGDRTEPLPDEWELYDLTDDPIESSNRWDDLSAEEARDELLACLDVERARVIPARNNPWPYVALTTA